MKKLAVLGICIMYSACSIVPDDRILIVLPATIAGPHRSEDDIVWKVRWNDGQASLQGARQIALPASDVYTAQAYDQWGIALGPAAGAVRRWSENVDIVILCHELGFISETAMLMQEAGAKLSRYNLERLQLMAMQSSDGRPFLLDSRKAAGMLLSGNVKAADIRSEQYDLPAALSDWRLHYPPDTKMPRRLKPGLYMIWHPFEGNGWLEVQRGQVSWSVFPAVGAD
ncbi:hypothetical protein [Spirochaeta dissipatitropha]